MRGGALRQRVTLQAPAAGKDSFGGGKSWTDVVTVWADVDFTSGREFSAPATEAKFTDEALGTVSIRWRQDIQATWRIKHDTGYGIAYYGITSITVPHGIRSQMKLTVRRVDTGEPVK